MGRNCKIHKLTLAARKIINHKDKIMKRIKISRQFALIVIIISILLPLTAIKAQSVHNEQYIALQNYLSPNFAITFGASDSLKTNYTFLLPFSAPSGLNQTLQVTSISGAIYTLGWGSTALTNSWMLQGNSGLTDGASNFFGTLDSKPIRFITNGTSNERMRISATGQVGIGTASPGQLLEVKGGNVLLSNSGTTGQLQIQGTSSGVTTFTSGAQGATNINYTLPTAQGTAGTVLQNDGSGALSWIDQSTQVGAVQFAIKGSDETVTNSSTLQNDNDLSFSIGANETWEVIAQLDADNGSNNSSKMKVSLTIPSGSVHVFAWVADGDGDDDDGDWISSSGSSAGNFELNGSDEKGPVLLQGLVIGGSTGGTVHIQWAPDTSSNSSVTVHTNSYLKATKAK
jgi:hypothetical protein